MYNDKILTYPGQQTMSGYKSNFGYCNFIGENSLRNRPTDNGGKLRKAKSRRRKNRR